MYKTENFAPTGFRQGADPRGSSANEEAFLFADWERVVFLHFAVDPATLLRYVPVPLELELYENIAWVTLVALTMRSFRPCRRGSPTAWLFRTIASQRFLNVRTYARRGDEPGALFLRGWLSQPFRVPLPGGLFGLPYEFASLEYRHQPEAGELRGVATVPAITGTDRLKPGLQTVERLLYRARVEPQKAYLPCGSGTLAQFALERYTGWFPRKNQLYVFRAWHPPWVQASIDVTIEDDSLLTTRFPWFKQARLVAAHYAPGFAGVQLGKSDRVGKFSRRCRASRSVLSGFYEMP